MANLKEVKNEELLKDLKILVQTEKKLIREVLEYLEEVEIRKLYLERGFSSMFAFCTDFLSYSPQEAQIRIQAMRLSRAVPEVKKQIEAGELSLSVAARVQAHVGREQKIRKCDGKTPMKLEEKRKIVESVRNQSVRKSEEILFTLFPHHAEEKPEAIKLVGNARVRVEMNLSKETYELLIKVRALRSHTSEDFDGLVRDLCQTALKKYDPELKTPKTQQMKALSRAKQKSEAYTPIENTAKAEASSAVSTNANSAIKQSPKNQLLFTRATLFG